MGRLIYWDLRKFLKNKLTYFILIILISANLVFAIKYNSLYKDVKSRVLSTTNINIDEIQGQINYFKEIESIRGLDENEKKLVKQYENMISNQMEKKDALIKGDNKRILANEIDRLKESTKSKSIGKDNTSKYMYDREKIELLRYEFMKDNDIKLIQAEEYYPSGMNLFLQISQKIYISIISLCVFLFFLHAHHHYYILHILKIHRLHLHE